MYKPITNEEFTEKTRTESCCTQKWEDGNWSVLQIKTVLCQGCTQNMGTFLCLVVHKQVVTAETIDALTVQSCCSSDPVTWRASVCWQGAASSSVPLGESPSCGCPCILHTAQSTFSTV